MRDGVRTAARTLLAAALAAALGAPARAAYDDLGNSARVTGMSNAYTAVADDAYAIYYNPAGLALLDRAEVATTYSQLVTGLSDNSSVQNSFIAYAQPISDGRYGVGGIGWNYFSLDSIYRESSLFMSYAHRLTPTNSTWPIVYGGVSAKYLYRSLNPGAIANNSISSSGQIQVGVPDPLLQFGSKSNFDVDLGLLANVAPRWDVGFQTQHFFAPNIAFTPGQTDILQRTYKFGGAYRTPFSTLAADFDLVPSPVGTMERDLNVGVEKWLPTLLYGSFGLRAGLGYGTDDYRQVTVGLSYRLRRLQVDYGFVMPVGSFASTTGTQRIGLTWRFGPPPHAEKLIGEMLLDNLTQAAPVGSPEFIRQVGELVSYKRRAIEALLAASDAEAAEGHFATAYEHAQGALALAPKDAVVTEAVDRYRTAALYFPDLSADLKDRHMGPTSASAMSTRDGLMKFIGGKDREALAYLVNGAELKPTPAHDAIIRILQARLGEPMVGFSTTTVKAVPPPVEAVAVSTVPESQTTLKRILDSTTALMELAFFQQEWDKVDSLAHQVLELDSKSALAYKRIAAAAHVQKRYPAALSALESAYALETDEGERERLKGYIDALKAQLGRGPKPAPAKPAAKPAPGPEEVERLYDAGVELYAQGKLSEALEAFHSCLQIDPGYVPALRAYERVQSELKTSGKSPQ